MDIFFATAVVVVVKERIRFLGESKEKIVCNDWTEWMIAIHHNIRKVVFIFFYIDFHFVYKYIYVAQTWNRSLSINIIVEYSLSHPIICLNGFFFDEKKNSMFEFQTLLIFLIWSGWDGLVRRFSFKKEQQKH